MSAEPTPPRIVKPLQPKGEHLPIIAVSMEEQTVLLERDQDQVAAGFLGHSLADLPRLIQSEPRSLVVVSGAARMLHYLDGIFTTHPDWQWRVTPDRKDVRLPNQSVGRIQVTGTIVNFFGFRAPEGTKKRGHYHYPVDPQHFCKKGIHELVEGDAPRVLKLLQWGADVRAWCESAGIQMKPSAGGVAGQLLRHPRFFPRDRRKVPKVTNARARLTLPGNYYRLHANPARAYQAYYLDMKTAHHNIAASLDFPDPDDLYARGWFRVTDETHGTVPTGRPWVKATDHAFRTITENAHGLMYVHLSVPKIPETRFPPPYLEKPGDRMAWIYTNELPMIRELGATVNYIAAAWVSFTVAPGLNKYAAWAMEELDQARAERKAWLKPTLLATYGVLAARPRTVEFGFRQANGGVPREYPAGSGMLQGMARITDTPQEVPTANVIYRGLIEAEQRKRSLNMARLVTARGGTVLAVYADSVFVDSRDFQLPLLPAPWVLEEQLDRLTFLSATSFTSAQLTKLPGLSREGAERLRAIEQITGSVRL